MLVPNTFESGGGCFGEWSKAVMDQAFSEVQGDIFSGFNIKVLKQKSVVFFFYNTHSRTTLRKASVMQIGASLWIMESSDDRTEIGGGWWEGWP